MCAPTPCRQPTVMQHCYRYFPQVLCSRLLYGLPLPLPPAPMQQSSFDNSNVPGYYLLLFLLQPCSRHLGSQSNLSRPTSHVFLASSRTSWRNLLCQACCWLLGYTAYHPPILLRRLHATFPNQHHSQSATQVLMAVTYLLGSTAFHGGGLLLLSCSRLSFHTSSNHVQHFVAATYLLLAVDSSTSGNCPLPRTSPRARSSFASGWSDYPFGTAFLWLPLYYC